MRSTLTLKRSLRQEICERVAEIVDAGADDCDAEERALLRLLLERRLAQAEERAAGSWARAGWKPTPPGFEIVASGGATGGGLLLLG